MSVEIELDTTDYDIKINNLLDRIPTFTQFLVENSGQIVKDEMVATVPVKTGKLKESIRLDVVGLEAIISTNSGYGKFVDLPTKPHIIRARNAQFLRIPLPDGRIIFRKQVFHTGTKGAFFRRKTLNTSAPKIKEMVEAKIGELFF